MLFIAWHMTKSCKLICSCFSKFNFFLIWSNFRPTHTLAVQSVGISLSSSVCLNQTLEKILIILLSGPWQRSTKRRKKVKKNFYRWRKGWRKFFAAERQVPGQFLFSVLMFFCCSFILNTQREQKKILCSEHGERENYEWELSRWEDLLQRALRSFQGKTKRICRTMFCNVLQETIKDYDRPQTA